MANVIFSKQPDKLSFAKNDLIWRMYTNNAVEESGMAGSWNLLFGATLPVEGDIIKFSFMNYDLQFTFSDTDDESGLILPLRGSDSLADWFDKIIEAFESNYTFNEFFYFLNASAASTIIIYSRNKGTFYDLDSVTEIADITFTEVDTPVDVVLRENYKLMVRVKYFYQVSGEQTIDAELRLPATTSDDFTTANFFLNVKPLVQSLCKATFTFPGETDIVIREKTDFLQKIFIEYAEAYDYEVKKLFNTKDDPVYIIPDGLDHITLSDNNDNDISPQQWLMYRSDFLTFQPREKYVLLNQPEFLSYIVVNDNVKSLILKAHITFVGGNETTVSIDTIGCMKYDAFEFDLSLFRLNLHYYDPTGAETDPAEVEFWLENQDGDAISVSRRYIITDETRYNRIFIARNALGCFDTIRMTGKASRESEIDSEITEQIYNDMDVSRTTFKRLTDVISEQQKMTVNSGWLSKVSTQPDAYRDYLRGLAMSREVYEVVNGKLYPCVILTGELVTSNDDDQLQAIEFEIARAYTDEHFVRDKNLVPEQYFNSTFNYRFTKK